MELCQGLASGRPSIQLLAVKSGTYGLAPEQIHETSSLGMKRAFGFERAFYHDQMGETESERILAALITGTAARYARGRPLTDAEEAKALASITSLAAGRTDLPAQVAGLAIGLSEGTPDEPGNNRWRNCSSTLAPSRS